MLQALLVQKAERWSFSTPVGSLGAVQSKAGLALVSQMLLITTVTYAVACTDGAEQCGVTVRLPQRQPA